jgi:hypothetical protein
VELKAMCFVATPDFETEIKKYGARYSGIGPHTIVAYAFAVLARVAFQVDVGD